MKVNMSKAVAFLVALGFAKATEWDKEKVQERLLQVPEKVDKEDCPEGFEEFYKELVAAKGQVELITGNTDAAPSKKEGAEKPKGKSKGKAEAKAAEADEEDEEDEEPAEDEDEEDEEKEEAKPSKKDKPAKKEKASKKDKPAKKEKAKKPAREVDAYGSAVGTNRAKVNATFSKDWKSEDAMASEAGLKLKQTRIRLRRAVRKGILEVRHLIEYRLATKKAKK